MSILGNNIWFGEVWRNLSKLKKIVKAFLWDVHDDSDSALATRGKSRLVMLTVLLRDRIRNKLGSRVTKPYSMVSYVIEASDWSIKWDGKYITENLDHQKLLKARSTITHKGICTQIIHFGSAATFFTSKGFHMVNKRNKVVLTWFHVAPDDPRIKYAKEAQKHLDLVHTTSNITRKRLIEIGIPEEKIVVIPLGVDLNLFKPVSLQEKQRLRELIGVPKEKLMIGSFQKDGVGWGDGLEPKWVKGPDTFVDVMEELKKDYAIFILLLGPARGYVKKELEKRGITYRHVLLKNYVEIPKYYNVLDLYLVSSRVEGGPKSILESMASGVPVVSTRVGMAPDIIKDGYNGFLSEVDDVVALSEKAANILDNKNLANQLASNGLETVKKYSWTKIVKKYYKKVYIRVL